MLFIMKNINCIFNTLIIILCCYTSLIQMEEIFDIKADDLMEAIVPKLMERHSQLHVPHKATTRLPKFGTIAKVLTAPELTIVENDAQNLTLAELNLRKRKLDIKTLLETNVGSIQNAHNVDEINVQTRRFNYIENSTNSNILRYFPNYEDKDLAGFNYKVRYRVLQLMTQFIYQTKYQLPYAQLLRKKYIDHIKYQIGYCFALLKNLKLQQMVIYNTLINYNEKFTTLYVHLKLYEKVVKLDVDIKDLIVYITNLNDIRLKSESEKRSTKKKRGQRLI